MSNPILLKSVRIFTRLRGQHDPEVAYDKMDEVQHQTSIYVAAQDIPAGVAITDPRWVRKLDNSAAWAAELQRIAAEDLRETAEIQRQQGEQDRNAQYGLAEQARDTAFGGAQTARARAYEDAEDARDGLYASAEAARNQDYQGKEAARQSQETARVNQEQNRQNQETLRQEHETDRRTNEAGRSTAEAARASAEAVRLTNEQGRVAAESGRVTVEQGRVTAEQGRATAESGRATAEGLRATAEQGRVTAEQNRVDSFDAMASATLADLETEYATTLGEHASQLAANTTNINNVVKTVGILTNSVDSFAAMRQLVVDGYGPLAFPVGTQIRTPHTEYGGGSIVWDVVAHDHHKNPSDPTAHTMSLLMRDVIYGRQFDAIEALYYCEAELPAGTYNFTLLEGYDTANGGGKTLQFTTNEVIPAGGIIMFPWASSTQSTATKISTYPTRESTTAIESNISVIEGTDGTNLGTADGSTPNMNHTHRIRYGSSNYAESAIRQWIKSAAAANAWWTPQTIFDRPPTYANVAGFLSGLDPEFVSILGAPEIVTARNAIYEIGGSIGGSYTTNDLVFLPSMTELGFGKNNNIDEGALLEYYDGAVNADRIKYDITDQTTARYWWLRGPSPSSAYGVRRVTSDGSLDSHSAISGLGAVAACVIM